MKISTKCFIVTAQFTPINASVIFKLFFSSIFLIRYLQIIEMFFAQVMLKVRGVIEPLQQTTRQQNEQCA